MILTLLLVLLVAVAKIQPAVTGIEHHVFEHAPGECHVHTECPAGTICYKGCNTVGLAGCEDQETIGYCTNRCSSDADCQGLACETVFYWESNEGMDMNLCVR